MGKSPFQRFNMSRMWICILPPKPPAFHVVAQARILSGKEGEKYGTGNPSRTQRPPWMDTELLDMVAYNANPPATFPVSRTPTTSQITAWLCCPLLEACKIVLICS